MRHTYISPVSKGKLNPIASSQIAEVLSQFEGDRVKITIEKYFPNRSNRQNNYYFGGVIPSQIDCFKEMWGEIWTKEEVHDWNKANIWCTEFVDEETGNIIKRPGSSKEQTTKEFEEKMEKLRQFFELNFEWKIPLPNEVLKFNFE